MDKKGEVVIEIQAVIALSAAVEAEGATMLVLKILTKIMEEKISVST